MPLPFLGAAASFPEMETTQHTSTTQNGGVWNPSSHHPSKKSDDDDDDGGNGEPTSPRHWHLASISKGYTTTRLRTNVFRGIRISAQHRGGAFRQKKNWEAKTNTWHLATTTELPVSITPTLSGPPVAFGRPSIPSEWNLFNGGYSYIHL